MASPVINMVIAIGSVAAWLALLLGKGTDAELAVHGIASLKYYTVLSNLFSALASTLYLAFCLIPGVQPAPWLLALKLAATTTVMITFLVTAVLLTPVYGREKMYKGGNFWLHLVLPLLALADTCFFAPVGTLPLWATLGSVLFTAIYACFYLQPILKYGAERDGVVYDFYGFMRWGKDKIWFVAATMLASTWAVSLLIYAANRLLN